MKLRNYIILLIFILLPIQLYAVKANPNPFTVIGPEGKPITLVMHGNESCNWFTDSSGRVFQGIIRNNQLTITSFGYPQKQMIHCLGSQSIEEQIQKEQDPATRVSVGNTTPSYFPHSGSPHALVILVNFKDLQFKSSNPKNDFNIYLNHLNDNGPHPSYAYDYYNNVYNEYDNYGSVAQYFKDISKGKFTPIFDIVGPVTVSKDYAYYGNNGSGSDIHYQQLIKEAVELVDPSVNFKDYDSDSDGNVDLVYIIYAGYSESNRAGSDYLWPKSGTLGSSKITTKDQGVIVNRFGINNELNGRPTDKYIMFNGIGLFCHEFCHTMGLPDIYPTIDFSDYKDYNDQSMEYWDLMDGGEYTGEGYWPTPLTPWETEALGWDKMISIPEQASTITLQHTESYKIPSSNTNKYAILQNIQQEGWYSKMPGHGLLVYRIAYDGTIYMSSGINNNKGFPDVTLLPADGKITSSYLVDDEKAQTNPDYITNTDYWTDLAGDPYPGITQLDFILSIDINGTIIDKPIYNIKESDGNITFDYLENKSTGIINFPSTKNGSRLDPQRPMYNINGQRITSDYQGIILQSGHKFITSSK